ncbi:MAG: M1 family metallopeptidase [Thermoanaerobaculia bacterium]|nr:M1 family metallopeptidase [Thermoanaerobaculia bacterium]
MRRVPLRVLITAAMALLASSAWAERLPRTVIPHHYRLQLSPELSTDSFDGEEEIDVVVQRVSTVVRLHAAELDITSAGARWEGSPRVPAEVTYEAAEEMAILTFSEPLPIGPLTLDLTFTGTLDDDLRGFYRGESGSGKKFATTQLEATDARRAFPCFDEPEWKAAFDVTLVVDEGLTAFSNGTVIDTTPGPVAGKKTVRFATTPRMSTYLVAFVVGDFSCLEGGASGVPIRVCAAPERVHLGHYALDAAEWLLPFFEDYFGVPYPFGKLDNIGVADFDAGAMENVGAVIYRETGLLVDPEESSLSQRKRVAAVVAHELAHQWFGDLVTMEWWDDLWLNEGFADFMESRSLGEWQPTWNPILANAGAAGWPLSSDTLRDPRAIRAKAETPEEINALFDGIAYGKTSAVLRMLESYVGPEAMQRGIHDYLVRHAYGNAAASDFFDALTGAAERPVGAVMESFVHQAGVPRVNATSRCEGTETLLDLSQDRFFVDSKLLGSDPKRRWSIPVCYAEGECVMLTEAAQQFYIAGCRAPLFINHDGRGYFVTEYSAEQIDLFRQELWTTLSPADRLILLRDEWMLVRAGVRPIGVYLDLISAFSSETEPQVFDQFLGRFSTLEERLLREEDRDRFQHWLRAFLTPIMERVGWEAKEGESELTAGLRQDLMDVLGTVAADPQVLAPARAIVESYLAGRRVDSNRLSGALDLAAIHGDATLYERYLQKLEEVGTPQEYTMILATLGSFRDEVLVRRTLERALSDKVKSQDLRTALRRIADNPQGKALRWDFLRERWSDYLAKIPPQSHSLVLPYLGRGICDATELEEFRAIAADKPFDATEMDETEEVIANCLDFRRRHADDFSSWLRRVEGDLKGQSDS